MATAKRAKSAETSFVECQDSSGVISVGNEHGAEIGQSGIEILVTSLKIDNPSVVVGAQSRDCESSRGNILKKANRGAGAVLVAAEIDRVKIGYGFHDTNLCSGWRLFYFDNGCLVEDARTAPQLSRCAYPCSDVGSTIRHVEVAPVGR